MNKKIILLAVMVAATMMLSACGPSTDVSTSASTPASSEAPPASSSSSEPAQTPAVTASSTPIAEVTTQTKTVEGFTGGQVNDGTLYINGGIAKLGDKLQDFDNELAKSGMMISNDKEQMKSGTSFSDGYIDYMSKDVTYYAMAMQFKWYNPFYEQELKLSDTTLFVLEARTWNSEGVQEYYEVGAEQVKEPEVVLPNGWYLGGTVSVADRMALLPGFEPDVNESDDYTWYHYNDSDKKACTLALQFDNATGEITEIQLRAEQIRK